MCYPVMGWRGRIGGLGPSKGICHYTTGLSPKHQNDHHGRDGAMQVMTHLKVPLDLVRLDYKEDYP
jgi:hypothetical protein